MTRGGKNARDGVDRLEVTGRLRKARAFHRVAQAAMPLLASEALDRAPVLSNAALAAIAYVDALTIASDGKVNLKDHATAPTLLRACLGRHLPDARLADLRGILSLKDEVQYGVRIAPPVQAEQVLDRLDRFAAWAEGWLRSNGIA